MRIAWFTLLFFSICLEGLGRRYLPGIPSSAFYFLKDVVLVAGFFLFPPPRIVKTTMKSLYGGAAILLMLGVGWTVVELFNPEQTSKVLGLIGVRSYWLWWLLAPVTVAGILQNTRVKRRAIDVLVITTIALCALGAVQFASPPTSAVNLYSVVDGEEVYSADVATVQTTGRARVAATFAFTTGFCDFVVLVPALLLSIGLESENKMQRKLALGATLLAAAVLPMTGARATVILGGGVLVVTALTSGLLFTRVGRRVMIGVVAAAVLATTAFPEALEGVQDRFSDVDETNTRLQQALEFLPPVAFATYEFPGLGIGTGMQLNARASFGVKDKLYNNERENGRYLAELGAVGYLLVWGAKAGLFMALWRCYQILKRAGRRATAGAALSYALLVFMGHLTFDHIYQSLFFIGSGFILSETMAVLKVSAQAPTSTAAPARILPGASQWTPDRRFPV